MHLPKSWKQLKSKKTQRMIMFALCEQKSLEVGDVRFQEAPSADSK